MSDDKKLIPEDVEARVVMYGTNGETFIAERRGQIVTVRLVIGKCWFEIDMDERDFHAAVSQVSRRGGSS